MKGKFKIFAFSAISSLIAFGCGACKEAEKEAAFAFEHTITEVHSGDKVTVPSKFKDVIYSFQGGTPNGVSLDAKSGAITFDEAGPMIPEKVYIASLEGQEDAYTIIHFALKAETPKISWNNVSSYLVDGDVVSASATSDSGRNYGVKYELKEFIPGIAIDSASGRVSYSSKVNNLTHFKVTAKAKNAEETKEFIAMTEGIVTASVDSAIVRFGSDEKATFKLDFGSNLAGDAETTSENIGYAYDGVIFQHPEGLSYDASTKEVTFSSPIIAKLAKGENKIAILTQRNPVVVSLIVCDNFLSSAEELASAFEANYNYAKPKFKKDSLSAYYVLTKDIDLSSLLSSDFNNGKGWAPIGAYEDQVYDIPFTGTFNGNGHTISGFTYNKPTAVCGLFGRSTGTIKNLTLRGEIPMMSSWSAALCGNNGGTIENVIVDVKMPNDGQYATGALCSVNHGTITNCLSINENVKGYTLTSQMWQRAGIAVGLNETDGSINKTFAIGDVSKYGLFGFSQNSEVTIEKAGILFNSLSEMKSYDFSSILNKEAFVFQSGELPTLRVR